MSLRTSEARRAEVASTRSKAQCAATEHRASEAQSGAKTRSDHAELRGGRTASALCAHRRPEGLKWRAHEAKRSAQSKAAKRLEARGHAQRASAAPEHRAAEGESGAKTRNTAQASAQGGAKMRNDHCELRGVAVAREQTLPPPACQKDFFDKRIFPSPRSCYSGSIQARAMLPAPRWMPSTGPMWRISALRPRSRK